MIYFCPPSTPLLGLRTQVGMPDMQQRVELEKICLVSRLLHTREEQENVAREVLQEQLQQGWPGLCQEVQEICLRVGLQDITIENIHRKEAQDALEFYFMKTAKEKMVGKEKYRHIINLDCRKMQPYMLRISLQLSRMKYLWNTEILDTRTTMKARY